MPIDLRTHDPDDPVTIRPGTNKAQIIKLLYRDTDLGYTPAEVREALDLPRGSGSTTLTRMHEGGLIGKTDDGYYHGLDHREDLSRFAASLVSLERLFERADEPMGPEDFEQTGVSVREEIPSERMQESEHVSDEPTPDEWVEADDESAQ